MKANSTRNISNNYSCLRRATKNLPPKLLALSSPVFSSTKFSLHFPHFFFCLYFLFRIGHISNAISLLICLAFVICSCYSCRICIYASGMCVCVASLCHFTFTISPFVVLFNFCCCCWYCCLLVVIVLLLLGTYYLRYCPGCIFYLHKGKWILRWSQIAYGGA